MTNKGYWRVSFTREPELIDAVRRLKEAGHEVEDAYSPYPIHGLDELMELRPSRLGWVTFLAGAAGAVSAFAFQAWSSAVSWPLNVGGKPNVSTLAFIPITFEVTILLAGLATAAAFLWRSRLYPRAQVTVAEGVTDDGFALVLDPKAGHLSQEGLLRLLRKSGGSVSPLPGKEDSKKPPASVLLLALLATGCFHSADQPAWDYLPDMRHSVPYDSFSTNPVFRDGKTLRRGVPGTIPRGFVPFPYGPEPAEAERAGRELENPYPPDPEVLARGEHLYETFCQVCHGETGAGDGPLVPKIAPPPAYTSDDVRRHPPGRIFHIVTWGSGRMPPYRAQISQDDRWRLVHWVRKLQTGEALP